MYLITFSFHCQSYEKTCGEDYWYFDITCREVQEKNELEKLAKHVLCYENFRKEDIRL